MKLNEIHLPPFYVPDDKEKRLRRLKSLIDQGHKPAVYDATQAPGVFTFGDLEDLGYAERENYHVVGGDPHDYYWVYTGPKPIELIIKKHVLPFPTNGKPKVTLSYVELNPGDRSDEWFGGHK